VKLPLAIPFLPMEAKLAARIPTGPDWEYEPKWDGFRCLAFRDEKEVELQSKAGQPLTRYFPEMVESLRAAKAAKFVLDGELIVPVAGRLSFDDLLQRIHPAASRVEKLSHEHPAEIVLFDFLVDVKGKLLVEEPQSDRRAKLEEFFAKYFAGSERVRLSLATRKVEVAKRWMAEMRGQLDGIVAKRAGQAYLPGERAMVKVKTLRSADCVVGGFRYGTESELVGSLLLGLYDKAGLLNHVGFTSGLASEDLKELTKKLEKLVAAPGFTGRAPGGPSRWSTERSNEFQPLKPKLVVEVRYDHFTGERFRHGTKLLRWRPDKDPKTCTVKQVVFESLVPFGELLAG
jgi:ATP-dependent DNA ligase